MYPILLGGNSKLFFTGGVTLKIENWALEKENKNTAYLCISMSGEGRKFTSLMTSMEEMKIERKIGELSSYHSDDGKLQWHRNRVYIDRRHQINFFTMNGDLQIVIGEVTLSIRDFEAKSKIKDFTNLTIAITLEAVSPVLCVKPWELLNFIVIKDIKK